MNTQPPPTEEVAATEVATEHRESPPVAEPVVQEAKPEVTAETNPEPQEAGADAKPEAAEPKIESDAEARKAFTEVLKWQLAYLLSRGELTKKDCIQKLESAARIGTGFSRNPMMDAIEFAYVGVRDELTFEQRQMYLAAAQTAMAENGSESNLTLEERGKRLEYAYATAMEKDDLLIKNEWDPVSTGDGTHGTYSTEGGHGGKKHWWSDIFTIAPEDKQWWKYIWPFGF